MNDRLVKLWNNSKRTPVVIGLIAFNVGVGVGYILGRNNKRITHEVDIQSFEDQLSSPFDIGELEKAVQKLEEKAEEKVVEPIKAKGENFVSEKINEIIVGPVVEVQDDELVTKSIFTKDSDDWNYELELRNRTKESPYIIHRDEFFEDSQNYTQSTLTYYSGDNILVDEDDSPVYNHEDVTGPLLFGHGSGDPNVLYVRNDKRRAEYEILFDPGLYSVEVLGLEIENNQRVEDLKHSKHRKFRQE